jgi:hypothetical protein
MTAGNVDTALNPEDKASLVDAHLVAPRRVATRRFVAAQKAQTLAPPAPGFNGEKS